MTRFSWVSQELHRLYPRANLAEWVDINRNDVRENAESTASSETSDQWLSWYSAHQSELSRFNPQSLFRPMGAHFSPQNIVYDVLSIEAERYSPRQVEQCRQRLTQLLQEVRGRIHPSSGDPQKIRVIFEVLRAHFTFRDSGSERNSLVDSMLHGNLECQTGSLTALILGQALGIPNLSLVQLPRHILLRQNDAVQPEQYANYDIMNPSLGFPAPNDREYAALFHLRENHNPQYLANMSRDDVAALSYKALATDSLRMGRYEEGFSYSERALSLSPHLPRMAHLKASLLIQLGRPQNALSVLDESVQSYPDRESLMLRARLLHDYFFRYEEAIDDCNRFIDLERRAIGDLQSPDLQRLRDLLPLGHLTYQLEIEGFVFANILRALSYYNLGQYNQARVNLLDYTQNFPYRPEYQMGVEEMLPLLEAGENRRLPVYMTLRQSPTLFVPEHLSFVDFMNQGLVYRRLIQSNPGNVLGIRSH